MNWQEKMKYENKKTKETYQDGNHKKLWRWLGNVSQNDVQSLQKTSDGHNNIKEKRKREKYWYIYLFKWILHQQ